MSSKFLMNANDLIEISNVKGLQEELDEIQEEIASGGGNKTIETFTQQITSTPADFGEYKLYAKSDGFYERGTGAEVKLAGGGGGGIEYIGSSDVVNEGLVFASGLSRDLVQNKTGYSLDSINNKLVVPDIKTDEHSSINTTLTNISYNDTDPLKPFTRIGGELDVDKIKNSSHTAELEFETSGKLLLNCDSEINMKASIFEFKDTSDTSSQTRGVLINLDENLGNYEISCPDWFMNLSNVYRIYGIETPNPDYIELDLAGIKLKTNNTNRISIESAAGIELFSNGGNINLNSTGNVLCSNTPTQPTSVATKDYVDSRPIEVGFNPVPLTLCDYLIPTQTSQFYYVTQATHDLTINNMCIYTNGSSTDNVFVAVYRGTLPNPVRIAYGTINTAGGVICNGTLTPSNVQIFKGEPLTLGLYTTSNNVDILAFYSNLGNNLLSGYTGSNLTTEMPLTPPAGLTGTSYGNARFGCMLY